MLMTGCAGRLDKATYRRLGRLGARRARTPDPSGSYRDDTVHREVVDGQLRFATQGLATRMPSRSLWSDVRQDKSRPRGCRSLRVRRGTCSGSRPASSRKLADLLLLLPPGL